MRNWHIGVATHRGTKKQNNEDSFLYRISKDHKGNEIAMFVVADGMGGYEVGDEASRLAIKAFKSWWEKRINKLMKKRHVMKHIIREGTTVFHDINAAIKETGRRTGKKMGTTASFLVMYQKEYAIIHVGDSRIYRLKGWDYDSPYSQMEAFIQEADDQNTVLLEQDPELLQLTQDHSWVEAQIRQGKLSKEAARNHPKRNVLVQCLGIKKTINPYVETGNYLPSDLFVLCSDGFHSLFSDKDIKNMLLGLEKEYGDLQSICEYLINFSNFSEAHDNVTLMLIRQVYIADKKRSLLPFF